MHPVLEITSVTVVRGQSAARLRDRSRGFL